MGKVTAVSALWTVLKPPSYFNAAWRRKPGGGPVLINLIHDVDNLRNLFGDVIHHGTLPRCSGEERLKATMAVAEALRRCEPVTFD